MVNAVIRGLQSSKPVAILPSVCERRRASWSATHSSVASFGVEADVGPGLGGTASPGPRGRGVVTPYAGLGLAGEGTRTGRLVPL